MSRLFYWFVYFPIGVMRRSIDAGGPLEQWRTARGRQRMRKAAKLVRTSVTVSMSLTDCEDVGGGESIKPVEVHLLTGKQFWDQTVFCVGSFLAHAGVENHTRSALRFRVIIHDDGTLKGKSLEALKSALPIAEVIPFEETHTRLDAFLPASHYPFLRGHYKRDMMIHKLIDTHLGASGWKLFLDSDMLFFRQPDFLLDWLLCPSAPCHMADCITAYGYPVWLLNQTSGAFVSEKINAGICGLLSENIDWEKLEHWASSLIIAQGPSYYLEQALVAMILSSGPRLEAPPSEYLIYPRGSETIGEPKAIMHHYVATSKPYYFRRAWQLCLERCPNLIQNEFPCFHPYSLL